MWQYIGTGFAGPKGRAIAKTTVKIVDPESPVVELVHPGQFAVWTDRPLLRYRDYPALRHQPLKPEDCPFPIAKELTQEEERFANLERELATNQTLLAFSQAQVTSLQAELDEAKSDLAVLMSKGTNPGK